MDYNDFEFAAFWVLCFAAALPLVAIGVFVHMRRGSRAMDWYIFAGCLGSIIYGCFAGILVGILFPPPYAPGLSEGQGLDLRGMALIFGSWIGGILGFLATLLTFAVTKFVQWGHRRSSTPSPDAGATAAPPR